MRLDKFLELNKGARSRSHASNLIKLGKVKVDDFIAKKPAQEVDESNKIEVDKTNDFASLGGIKLCDALDKLNLNINNFIAIDIGASNGGFTDVLLRKGVAKVYAVDVADCALPDILLEDSRVVVKDNLNARDITINDIGEKVDLVVIDVSFISLKLILQSIPSLLKPNGKLIALIKPQFEVGQKKLTKSGIVSSLKFELLAVEDIKEFANKNNLAVIDTFPAPHPFVNKNQEYILYSILKVDA